MIEGECVKWDGRHRKEDGRPLVGKKYAYRVKWIAERGPLTEEQILHHKYENKWCVNLNHLEPITQGQHILEHGLPGDWGQANKTHCPADHPYDEENTYFYKSERRCKTCRRISKENYRARERAAGRVPK